MKNIQKPIIRRNGAHEIKGQPQLGKVFELDVDSPAVVQADNCGATSERPPDTNLR
jgi:hypothetical protein